MTDDARKLRWLRLGVFLAYAFNGFALAAWSVRVPGIADALDLSTAELSGFLLAGALGTLAVVTVAGWAVQRFGPRATYQVATLVFVVAYVGLGASSSGWGFVALLAANVLHGGAFALTNVPQSILAAETERRISRTIIPQFHASYSIGAAAGAALGGLAAGLGMSLLVQFVVLAVLAIVVRGSVVRCMGHRPHPSKHDRIAARAAMLSPGLPSEVAAPSSRLRRLLWNGRRSVWREPQTLLLGLLVFGAALSEGAANNWLSVAVVGSFGAEEWVGAAGLTTFLVAQTIGRLGGGPLVDRFGRLALLRASGVVTAIGVLLFAMVPSLPFVFVGAALWGLGAALAVPICITIAASDQARGPSRVAAVTSLSSLANIAGPPLLGALGSLVGIRLALSAVSAVVGVGVGVARRAVSR